MAEAGYRRHLADKGHLGEWKGYPYEDEPLRPGLALDEAIVDAVCHGNFERIFAAS